MCFAKYSIASWQVTTLDIRSSGTYSVLSTTNQRSPVAIKISDSSWIFFAVFLQIFFCNLFCIISFHSTYLPWYSHFCLSNFNYYLQYYSICVQNAIAFLVFITLDSIKFKSRVMKMIEIEGDNAYVDRTLNELIIIRNSLTEVLSQIIEKTFKKSRLDLPFCYRL